MVRAVRPRRTAIGRRGSGLPTVLMVSALLLVAAFTIVGLGYNHLSVSNRLNGSVEAKCLAEAALAKGLEELQVDKDFGRSIYTGPNPTSINVTFPSSPPGASGLLTFDQTKADLWKIRRSTNNFDGLAAAGGDGAMVPKDAVHLVGVGRCNGVTRTVDAVLYLPKYPFAISSTGPVETEGGLYVASVESEADIADPSKHTKGHLVTNSNAGAAAAVLNGSGNKITGDLQSASGATVGTSVIEGETRLNSSAADIPNINISSYDTTGKTGLKTLTSDTGPVTTSASPLNGFVRFDGGGTRTITFESLHLDKGVIYVDGNLQVNQGVFGKGAIIVKGTTTIRGGGALTSDNGVALLSGKKIDIAGDPSTPSVFKGLMYSEGGLASKDMKLRGVFVNNDPLKSATNATNSEIIQTPDNSNMQFQVQTSPGTAATDAQDNDGDANFDFSVNSDGGALYNPDFTIPAFGTLKPTYPGIPSAGAMPAIPPVELDVDIGFDPSIDAEQFKVGGEYKLGYMAGAQKRRAITVAPGYVADPTAPMLSWSHMRVKVGGTSYAGTDVAGWRAAVILQYKQKLRDKQGGTTLTGPQDGLADSTINGKLDSLQSGSSFNAMAVYLSSQMALAQQQYAATGTPVTFIPTTGTSGTPATSEPWKINLSDFISRNERVRILYWRET